MEFVGVSPQVNHTFYKVKILIVVDQIYKPEILKDARIIIQMFRCTLSV